ncbi:fibronectin type III domain-containing protein [Aureivirga sp. CE67]|uniref:T9SS type A sorting domain-containing protein n=1 Tax=Aureivirga sp. CE67 TaxID=1788983 RepID=UPI0018C8ECD4|nr:fibronectin type III domain-containing protein [Aureivirga sp. CE67]
MKKTKLTPKFLFILLSILFMSNKINAQCEPPTNPSVTEIGDTYATFNFTYGNSTTSSDIAIVSEGEAPGSVFTSYISGDAIIQGSLTAGTTYDYYVRSNCYTIGEKSEWVGPITFTTLGGDTASCLPPTGLNFTDITSSGVTLNWTITSSDNVDYAVVANGAEITLNDIVYGFGSSEAVSSLTPNTTYDVYLRTFCGNEVSEWTGVQSFTTLESTCPAPSDIVVTEITETSAKITWTKAVGDDVSFSQYLIKETSLGLPANDVFNAVISLGGTTEEIVQNSLQAATEYSVYVKTYCTDGENSEYAEIVTFTTLGGETTDCELPSDLSVADITETTGTLTWDTNGNTSEFFVYQSTDAAPTEDSFGTWVLLLGGDIATENLTDLLPGTEYTVYIRSICDDVKSEFVEYTFTTLGGETTDCELPSDLSVADITETTGTLTWNTNGNTSEFFVYQSIEAAPTEDSFGTWVLLLGGDIATENLTDLLPGTEYTVYIRSICDDVKSEFVEYTFTTLEEETADCDAADLPYVFGFPNANTDCWELNANDASTDTWATVTFASNISDGDGGSIKYQNDTDTQANAWVYSRGVNLVAGQTIEVKFDYKTKTNPEKLRVTIGTEKAESNQEQNVIWDNNGGTELTNTEFEEGVGTFTVVESGVYYVGLNCYSGADSWRLFVDNIRITEVEQTLECNVPTNVMISNITETTATVTWTTGGADSWEVIVVASTEAMPDSGDVVSEATYNATGLTENTAYNVYVRDLCDTDVVSEWTAVETFTTLMECNVPTNVIISDITETTATVTWTTGGADSWEVIVVASTEAMPDSGDVVSEATYNATELTENTAYNVYVRDLCDTDVVSEWTAVETFTTLMECNIPTNVMISDITETTATVTWTTGGADSWEVIVVASTEAMPDSGDVVSEATYNATGLMENTAYNVYVRDLCDTDVVSEWTAVETFTTASIGIEEDFINNFKMYPNPVSNTFTISFNHVIDNVEIYNAIGQLVFEQNVNAKSINLNVENFETGAYTLKVQTQNKVFTQRLLKK